MDLSMPVSNDIEAIHAINKRYPSVRVLVLMLCKSDKYIQESLRAGTDGYILKNASALAAVAIEKGLVESDSRPPVLREV